MTPPLHTPPAFIVRASGTRILGGWDGTDPALPGRQRFLAALAAEEPRLLATLQHDVLPLYQEAIRHERRFILDHSGEVYPPRTEVAEWITLEEHLWSWAEGWYLTAPWVRDAAVWTMHSWDADLREGHPASERWELKGIDYTMPTEAEFTFKHGGWTVGAEGREEAAAAIRADFERQLEMHLDRVQGIAVERGYRPAHASRAGSRPGEPADPARHYHWLARWQLGLARQVEIARKAKVTPGTVARALQRVADEIGLPLRRSQKTTRRPPHRSHKRRTRH